MRVILFGYYGFGNAGDEGVLAGLLHGLRRQGPRDVEYVVLSGNPKQTEALHQVQARPRNHWRTLLSEASEGDVWVFGGGSLLQDVTGPLTLPFYLGVMSLLTMRRRRFVLHAQGVGPITGSFGRLATGRLVSKAARISVRDVASAKTLAKLGVPDDRVQLGADLAFLLPAPEPAGGDWGGQALVGVAVREWAGMEHWLPELVKGLGRFMSAAHVQLLLVPMDGTDDAVSRHIVEQLPGQALIAGASAPFTEKMRLLASCSMVLAMRLHAGVFAALGHVPPVFIAYDPKVTAMAEQLSAKVVSLDDLAADRFFPVLMDAWNGRSAMAPQLAASVGALRQRAEEDLQGLVGELVGQSVATEGLSRR